MGFFGLKPLSEYKNAPYIDDGNSSNTYTNFILPLTGIYTKDYGRTFGGNDDFIIVRPNIYTYMLLTPKIMCDRMVRTLGLVCIGTLYGLWDVFGRPFLS